MALHATLATAGRSRATNLGTFNLADAAGPVTRGDPSALFVTCPERHAFLQKYVLKEPLYYSYFLALTQ